MMHFHNCPNKAARSYAVGPHPHKFFFSILVLIGKIKRLRKLGAKFKDIPNLNTFAAVEIPIALRAVLEIAYYLGIPCKRTLFAIHGLVLAGRREHLKLV